VTIPYLDNGSSQKNLPMNQPTKGKTVTDAQIKHMVDRFLSWRLPDNFSPDNGISFARLRNIHTDPPSYYPMPVGTNLLSATQAEAMVRHMIEGMP